MSISMQGVFMILTLTAKQLNLNFGVDWWGISILSQIHSMSLQCTLDLYKVLTSSGRTVSTSNKKGS